MKEIINKETLKVQKLENPFDCFKKSVALQLKNLNYKNVMIAQSIVQNILSEMAVKKS